MVRMMLLTASRPLLCLDRQLVTIKKNHVIYMNRAAKHYSVYLFLVTNKILNFIDLSPIIIGRFHILPQDCSATTTRTDPANPRRSSSIVPPSPVVGPSFHALLLYTIWYAEAGLFSRPSIRCQLRHFIGAQLPLYLCFSHTLDWLSRYHNFLRTLYISWPHLFFSVSLASSPIQWHHTNIDRPCALYPEI